MQWENIKNIIRTPQDKAIVIEDGEPRFVILTIEGYTQLQNTSGQSQSEQTQPAIEDFEAGNKELSSLDIDDATQEDAEKMII